MPKPPWHRIAVAALVERDGRYLVSQRPEGGWGAGMWEFPGGTVDENEDPRVALARECMEEVGVTVEVGDIYEVASHHYDFGMIVLLFFRCRILEGEPRPMEDNPVDWLHPEDMAHRPFLPADIPIIALLESEPAHWRPARRVMD